MMDSINEDSFIFILFPLIASIVFLMYKLPFIAFGLFCFSLFNMFFFRDPYRKIEYNVKHILSPADGKIVKIREETLFGVPYLRISIFLSIFNVHIQRSPIGGEVKNLKYEKGKYLAAFKDKASFENEKNTLIISNPIITIAVSQIAGIIARRVVCWKKKGEEIKQGEKFGLIRYGSRVDICIPKSTDLNVEIGQYVTAGKTIIATINKGDLDKDPFSI